MHETHSQTIDLLIELIQRESVTPDDKGCQQIIAQRLKQAGFTLEFINKNGVSNCWARRGSVAPLMVFAGHTDVVPSGDTSLWSYPPFAARIVDGHIIGRGAADMKGGLAAMVTAIERYVNRVPDHAGSIAMLLTSDEEGPAIDGTRLVVDRLQSREEHIDFCIVGEPSSNRSLGDTLRIGRRGSLGARLTIQGTQGHVAYPHLADNPIHRALPMLSALTSKVWDQGDAQFPPTTLQISNIHAGTGATNVIPSTLLVDFNLRYGPATTVEQIKQTVEGLCREYELNAELDWNDSARPFITRDGQLTAAITQSIKQHTGLEPSLDTGGGTSDGRFIAPTGAQVIEFGPINASIHQIDERVCIEDIDTLSSIFEHTLDALLANDTRP